jgi:DNA-binding response OmpR family regulator
MEKLLVIDDDPGQLEAVEIVLKRNSYDVTAAPDGMSGIKELERIIMIWFLPILRCRMLTGWKYSIIS